MNRSTVVIVSLAAWSLVTVRSCPEPRPGGAGNPPIDRDRDIPAAAPPAPEGAPSRDRVPEGHVAAAVRDEPPAQAVAADSAAATPEVEAAVSQESCRIVDRPFSQAKLVKQVKPTYPKGLDDFGGGVVILQATITTDGGVRDVEVLRSAGSAAVDRAYVDAVKQWVFEPALEDGEPICMRLTVASTICVER